MRRHPPLRHGLLALSVALVAPPSSAGDDCDAPLERWQTREAVLRMASGKGWQVQRLKIDDGCYEIRATDVQGRAFRARLDPETLKVLKSKHGDHRRDRLRDRDGEGPAGPDRPPPGAASAPSPEPAPGSAPRR